MPTRATLKQQAKAQIKGNIGILFICSLLLGLISGTGVGALLAPALSVGIIAIYFGLIDGQQAEISTLFSKLNLFGRALWLNIIVAFFTMLWSMLLIIPGIIKSLAYSMSFYILADNPELTAREALRESKRITKGHKGEIFVLQLSFIPWILLCGITFGLAFIYVGPYMEATMANYYKELKKVS